MSNIFTCSQRADIKYFKYYYSCLLPDTNFKLIIFIIYFLKRYKLYFSNELFIRKGGEIFYITRDIIIKKENIYYNDKIAPFFLNNLPSTLRPKTCDKVDHFRPSTPLILDLIGGSLGSLCQSMVAAVKVDDN